jgi:hypothetical protein
LRCRCPIGDAVHVFPAPDDSDFVVFCFAKPEDAEAFAKRFGGSGCLRIGDNPESNRGGPSALFRANVSAGSCRRVRLATKLRSIGRSP